MIAIARVFFYQSLLRYLLYLLTLRIFRAPSPWFLPPRSVAAAGRACAWIAVVLFRVDTD